VKDSTLLYRELKERIFKVSASGFEELALELFRHQYHLNPVYQAFCSALKKDSSSVQSLADIPFLPVEFFKTHEVVTAFSIQHSGSRIFLSSGTTQQHRSRHIVSDVALYETSFRKGFELFYGDLKDYAIFALLPSYEEQGGSSLIYMMNDLVKQSAYAESGFYSGREYELTEAITRTGPRKKLLIGVSYALLDLAEKHALHLENTIVMETGGMKGRRKEMVREELHEQLCSGFGVSVIHSEYGMTELLSQAYSKGRGIFHGPPWMHVMVRDTEDPFRFLENGRTGGVNIIDLANMNSCCFIATQDLGKIHEDGSFEVLGRFDNSEIRGCNLLAG
jgi:phenylacetate-coenzyme A ligase PaaK-like adenylate-forming protein